MGGSFQYSPKPGYPAENDDEEYVSRLSDTLVETIQEAKDTISEIECIFCSRLYSNFQMKSKSLQEAKKEAEDSWKEKERNLLLQIERLQLEKQQVLEENQCLMLEKEKSLEELNEQTKSLVLRERRSQQVRIDELEEEVRKKSKEVGEVELRNRLHQLLQKKSISDKGKELKEHEEKTNGLIATVKSLEKKVEVLEDDLRRKTLMEAVKNELTEDLLKWINSLLSHLSDNDQLSTELEKEKKKLECFEEELSELQKKLLKKTEEFEDGRVSLAQLLQQIEVNKLEILKQKLLLEDSEKDKKLLLEKVNALEEKINELKENLGRNSKFTEGKCSYEKLLQQIELKDSQLLAEKKKASNVLDAYKRLNSQYTFVCANTGLIKEIMLSQIKFEDESGSLTHQQIPKTSPDFGSIHADTTTAAREIEKMKNENYISNWLKDGKAVKSIPKPSFHSPTSSCFAPKCPPTAKSAAVVGTKWSASRWVDTTRYCQCREGPDPYYDFLDTPLKNLRKSWNETIKERPDLQIPSSERYASIQIRR
ncbi:protein gamma response 1-like [Hevea brasiliensis]|uniref:protein gamma response 1-like n=1 Tax=Hevea brasiliensis TaxID=3981 RepID=UPI0025CB89CC|nr:protein gamma response 1-like [Hevea brasiliensis]